MGSHSYAGEKWLLFAREDNGFVFTAVILQEHYAIAEIKVDESALKEHSKELGLEIKLDEFKTLFLRTLEQRQCVNLDVETEGNENKLVKGVFLTLLYKFSPTISRKGIFHLPVVVADAPQSIVALLASIHVTPPRPTLSEQQQLEKVTKESLPVATKSCADLGAKNVVNIHEIDGAATSLQSSWDAGAATATGTPELIKRRRVPTGTMRRKGPRGAKLVKK